MPRRSWKTCRVYTSKGYQRKRSRSHRREFVRGGADSKIRIFEFGNKSVSINDFEVKIGLMIMHSRRLSHFTLEAIRIAINRRVSETLGKNDYHVRLRAHPHDTYREHAMMAFAGADRLSTGMRNAFGRPVGKCARIKAGEIVIEIGCLLKDVPLIKKAFEVAGSKICSRTRVVMLKAQSPEIAAQVPLSNGQHYIPYLR
jgi:large subunit ribosomal protein L10e